MSDTDLPQPDRIEGAPHPAETPRLFGQARAEAAFLEAYTTGRLHHAWLFTGPRGVGKATLAWQIARFLLATPEDTGDDMFGTPPPPKSLQIPPDHPVARRIAARSEPGLKAITRSLNDKTGRLRDQIVVDDVRALSGFFHLSASEGGRRVVIIDAADDLNIAAANALLKMLEEPPERAVLLLVAHQPARLLPTIRSRCRTLRLSRLGAEDMAEALQAAGCDPAGQDAGLSELAAGSVGDAIRLLNLDGMALYRDLLGLMKTLPRLDRAAALTLAEGAAKRGAEARLDLLFDLIEILLSRLARSGALGQPLPEAAPGEAKILAHLAPDPARARGWADTAQTALARARHGRAVNLDPAALVLDTLFKLQETAPA